MTDHSFDKFIKETLNDHSLPVREGLWEKIQQENDKRVKGLFWWKNYGFIALIGVAALLICVILINQNKETPSAETKETTVTQNHHLQNSPSPTNQNTVTDHSNKTASKPGVTDDKTLTAKANKLENSFNGNPTAAYNNPGQNYSTKTFISKKRDKRSMSDFQSDNKLYNNGSKISSSLNKEISSSISYKPVLLATAEADKNLHIYSANDGLMKELKDFNLFCSDGCPSAREQVKNNLHLEIFASPDYTRKTIQNAGGVDEVFLNRKDSTESPRLSFSAGFRLTKTFGENFLPKTGLQYSQINEKFSYRSENERKQTTLITIRKEILATGDTLMIRDTSTIEQIGYRVKTTYNRYRSIDVPLIAGYQWGNDNLKAAVSAGVILNLYSWQKGESLDTSYVPVAFNKDGGRTFKRNIGIGLYTGFSVLKKAGENTWLFAEPYFRYNVSKLTNNRSLFNQKFDVAGLNIGIRYKLNSIGQRYYNR